MNDGFKSYILQSSLTESEKDLLIYTGLAKIRKDQDFNVGEFHEAVEKCEKLCNDIRDLEIPDKLYCYLFYYILIKKCDYSIDIYRKLIKSTLFNDEFRKKIMELPTYQSGFVSFMKTAGPYVEELLENLREDKVYLALNKYKELVDLCNNEVISPDLSEEELKEELDKRFFQHTFANDYNNYKKRINNLKFKSIAKEYDKKKLIIAETLCPLSFALQKVLHEIMIDYYNKSKSKCLYNQINGDINIFHIGDIALVTYKYDDIPDMVLKAHNLYLHWKTRDFWAKIFNPNIRFSDNATVHYTIENDYGKEMYMVVPRTFRKKPFKDLHLHAKKVIYAPEKYKDEALYLGLTNNGRTSLEIEYYQMFQAIGFNFEDLDEKLKNTADKLLTGDYSFFFKNPKRVDELDVSNLADFTHLGLIKTKQENSDSRKRCIDAIIREAKKNPLKPTGSEEKPIIPRAHRKLYPKKEFVPRLPYKD